MSCSSKAPHGITDTEAAHPRGVLAGPNARTIDSGSASLGLTADHGGAATPAGHRCVGRRALTPSRGHGAQSLPGAARGASLLRTTAGVMPVRSTLDGRLQGFAADTLRRHLMAVRTQRVYDGAVLVVENRTAGGIGLCCRKCRISPAPGMLMASRPRRQTGSILKPFLYGLALERKILTPASLLEDAPLDVPVLGGLYRPRNYDEQFRGLVSVRTALAASLNIPAVRTLELVGAEAFVQQLRRLGLEGAIESGEYYGPSLALGSVDASLWELVHAYRTLATGGVWTPTAPDRRRARHPVRADRVYSEATAFLLSHILADRGQPQRHIRTRKPACHSLLECRENRHQ